MSWNDARDRNLALIVFLLVSALLWLSPVRIINDSQYTLLVSENLLRTGTFHLDRSFVPPLDPALYPSIKRRTGLPYQVMRVGEHIVPYYAPGGPLLAAPFMAIANAAGKRVIAADGRYQKEVEGRLQRHLAALLMGGLAALMFRTARLLLPPPGSAAVVLATVFGSPIWSTASRALWSDTWGVLIVSMALHGLVRAAMGGPWPSMALLASLLSLLYVVKPTYAVAIVPIAAYVAIRRPRGLPVLVLTGGAWFLAFLAWSHAHYGALLPPYYQIRPELHNLGERLLGTFVSPSRGLLVFCPIVLAVLGGVAWRWRTIEGRPLAVLAILVIGLHLLATASHRTWWAGVCYGPRYMTALVPWFFLLALLWLRARGTSRVEPSAIGRAAIATLLLLSVALNGRGALDRATKVWNSRPYRVDETQVWSWRYPQFLAGLVAPPLPSELPTLPVGSRVIAASRRSSRFLWFGWSHPDGESRTTDGRRAEIVFSIDAPSDARLVLAVRPYLKPPRIVRQRLALWCNGACLLRTTLASADWRSIEIPLPAASLAPRNRIVLELPDARDIGDEREPGVALRELLLRKATSG